MSLENIFICFGHQEPKRSTHPYVYTEHKNLISLNKHVFRVISISNWKQLTANQRSDLWGEDQPASRWMQPAQHLSHLKSISDGNTCTLVVFLFCDLSVVCYVCCFYYLIFYSFTFIFYIIGCYNNNHYHHHCHYSSRGRCDHDLLCSSRIGRLPALESGLLWDSWPLCEGPDQ